MIRKRALHTSANNTLRFFGLTLLLIGCTGLEPAVGTWIYYDNNSGVSEHRFVVLNLLKNGHGNFQYEVSANNKKQRSEAANIRWEKKGDTISVYKSNVGDTSTEKLIGTGKLVMGTEHLSLFIFDPPTSLTLARRRFR